MCCMSWAVCVGRKDLSMVVGKFSAILTVQGKEPWTAKREGKQGEEEKAGQAMNE